jgi:hypothetical protein
MERLNRLRAERQRVHQIAASGINCQQPAQEPTLADLEIDDRFVLGPGSWRYPLCCASPRCIT